jgi:arsenate reductase
MTTTRPLNVRFLCTHNSARSQIAEAIMLRKIERQASGRFYVASAGSTPAESVNPMAIDALKTYRIEWSGRQPKSIDAVCGKTWDLITVCDRAKETCPATSGQPAVAHWGMDDPSDMLGPRAGERAFTETATYLSRRIDLLLSLPVETHEKRALELPVQRIAEEAPIPSRRFA